MLLPVLAALASSKNPEEFANYLLHGLRNRKGLPLEISRNVVRRVGGQEAFENLLASVGRGDYHRIVFFKKSNPNRICQFEIGRTVLHRAKAIGGQPAPRARILEDSLIHLDRGDYNRLAQVLGEHEVEHGGSLATKSRHLLIPRKLLEHDEWSARLQEGTHAGEIRVELEDRTFERLQEHNGAERFLNRYLQTLEYLSGGTEAHRYAKHLGLKEQDYASHPGFNAYQIFHVYSSGYREFMWKIPEARSEKALGKLIQHHTGIGGEFAKEFARVIWRKISGSELTHARRIAGDTLAHPQNIRL